MTAAAAGDPAAFDEYLRAIGLGADDLARALADGHVVDGIPLPRWATGLEEFVASVAAVTTSRDRSCPPAELFERCRAAGEHAAARFVTAAPVVVSPAAIEALGDQIARRVLTAAAAAIDFELGLQSAVDRMTGTARRVHVDASVDGWLDRLERLPALGYAVGTVFAGWSDSTAEMFRRLCEDWPLLCERAFGGTAPRRLRAIAAGAGDPHDRGRSVAILTFDGRRRIVYKPKDLRGAAALLDLVRWLDGRGLPCDLPTRLVLPRGAYGWEECLSSAACANGGAVERFYLRMGMMLRVWQLCAGRDLWLDNLIAAGEYPMFVDLETLLQPRERARIAISTAERFAWDIVEESVALTGVLAAPLAIGVGIPAEDLGALTKPRRFRTPFRPALDALAAAGAASRVDRHGHMQWQTAAYAPHLDGKAVDSAMYLDALCAGYVAMDERLAASRAALLAADSPLRRLVHLPVRYIFRDTWSYYAVISDSLSPAALGDGIARELVLSHLHRDAIGSSDRSASRIAAAEIAALRDLDIPLFRSVPTSDALELQDGSRIPGYFDGTACARLMARTSAPPAVAEQLDLLRSCFDAAQRRRNRPSAPRGRTAARADADAGRWLAEATTIADAILGAATRDDEGGLAWVGLRYDPRHGIATLGVLGPDLLSGTAGLAVLFADLFAVSGADRFERAARRLLGGIDLLQREPRLPADRMFGGFVGVGASVYALRRCARSLRDPSLGAMATRMSALPPPVDGSDDVACGRIGWLLATAAPAEYGWTPPLDRVRTVADVVAQRAARGDALVDASVAAAPFLTAVPRPVDGLSVAMARCAALGLSSPCAPPPGPSSISIARCAARLCLPRAAADRRLMGAVRRHLSTDVDGLTASAALDALDLAVTAHAVSRDPGFLDVASICAGRLEGLHRATGRWLSEGFAADRHRLSIVCGLAAVAHGFLRLADPRLGSVRLLA